MATWTLTPDTLLDLAVNAVPLVVLLGFSAMFLARNPWGWEPFVVGLAYFLTLFPVVVLVVVSYVAGLYVQRDEHAT